MVAPRKSDPSGKKVSKLYVEPAELARKLIKELEGTKVSQGGRTWVRDQYTVFLCREDFARFRSHLDELVRKLESHMEKHVQNRRYATSGAMTIELTMDPDLKPGYFGVLAERADLDGAQPQGNPAGPSASSVWDVPDGVDYDDEAYATDSRRGRGPAGQFPAGPSTSAPPLPRTPSPGVPGVGVPSLPGVPPSLGPSYARPFAAPPGAGQPYSPPSLTGQQPPQVSQPAPPPVQPRPAPPMPTMPAVPRATAPASVAPAGPATETLVLKVNGQERVFPQGKAVVGRSRDVDLQIDNADVSRRHAVIYWSEGSIVVKDLGSTNGTMVNGYPVDSTVVRPSDVIRIGNATITAASR
jgi:hypothetical protein